MTGTLLWIMAGLVALTMAIIDFLHKLTDRYARAGKKLHLRHLSEDCRRMLDNASAIIDVNHWEDPRYKVVSDELG